MDNECRPRLVLPPAHPHVRHALFARYAFGLACYSEAFLFKPEEEAQLDIYLYGAGEG